MKYINTTFAWGNGPYSRILDLGLSINQELQSRGEDFSLPIIIPLTYGDGQKRIIQETFPKDKLDLLFFDEHHGSLLNQLFFKEGSYSQNLEFLLANQPRIESQLRNYLHGGLELTSLNGSKKSISFEDIALEISFSPLVATGVKNSFYVSMGLLSEILESSLNEKITGLDLSLVRETIPLLKRVEEDRQIHFIPEPSVFSYNLDRVKSGKEISIPPFIHTPHSNYEQVAEGMYVMITGIDGLNSLFNNINHLGMKVYCSPFANLDGADNTHSPNFVSNPNIKYQFARTGWSSVWLSHLTQTPLITPAYLAGDDPEIYFNEKTVLQLGIATVYSPSVSPSEIFKQADNQVQNMVRLNQSILRNYGCLDGIDYTAKIIVDSILGVDLESYKAISPILSCY